MKPEVADIIAIPFLLWCGYEFSRMMINLGDHRGATLVSFAAIFCMAWRWAVGRNHDKRN